MLQKPAQSKALLKALSQVPGLFVGVSVAMAIPGFAAGASNPQDFASWLSNKPAFDRLKDAMKGIELDSKLSGLLKKEGRALTIAARVTGESVETTKFQDYFNGLEVIGSMAFHHAGAKGTQVRSLLAKFDLDVSPALSIEEAASVARSFTGDRGLLETPELKVLPMEDDSARLVYWVAVDRDGLEAGRDLIINAHTGEVIANMSHEIELAPINVHTAKDQGVEVDPESDPSTLPAGTLESCQVLDETDGSPLLINPTACKLVIRNSKVSSQADEGARRALTNSRAVLNYYQATHGRNSYDGLGSRVTNVVHIGKGFANAHWNSRTKYMAYGDGDGVRMGDLTRALDVAGHEMTHGVVSSTAKLIYMGESGALNEASADFFGKMIAKDGDWAVGKKVFIDPNAKGIRNIANPHDLTVTFRDPKTGQKVTKPYPANMSEEFQATGTCGGTNDNCWVHVNSTIFSNALYRATQAVGTLKVEKMYYLALTQYLNARADFRTARDATVAACGQLYDTAICGKVEQAFAAVGL